MRDGVATRRACLLTLPDAQVLSTKSIIAWAATSRLLEPQLPFNWPSTYQTASDAFHAQPYSRSAQAAKRWLTLQQTLYKGKPSCICSFLSMQLCDAQHKTANTDKNKIQVWNQSTYAAKGGAARARTSLRKFMGTPVLRMRAIWLGELNPAQ